MIEMELTPRHLVAIGLMILAILGGYASIANYGQSLLTNVVQGTLPIYNCTDLPNLWCNSVVSTGIQCTPTTIGTATCQLPNNGCDGVYRVGVGRCEKGTDSCTIISTSLGTCTKGSTFSPAFTNSPHVDVPLKSVLGFNPTQVIRAITTGYSFTTAPVSAPLYWNNMPATVTPLFADSFLNNTITTDGTQFVGGTFNFGIVCLAASTAVAAKLYLRYSTDGGLTFNDLGSASAQLDISTVCAQPETTGAISLPAGFTGSANVVVQIFGTGGAGAGDKPAIGNSWVTFISAVTTFNNGIFPPTVSVSFTTVTLTIKEFISQTSGTLTITWFWTAISENG